MMDFIMNLPSITRKLIGDPMIVDRLKKGAHFIALMALITSTSVANSFSHEIIKFHGFPKSLLSDRDPLFLGSFWHHLFKQHHTKLLQSSAYHTQIDEQLEVVNRGLQQFLCCLPLPLILCMDNPLDDENITTMILLSKEILELAKTNFLKARERMKKQANNFDDQVLVKLQKYRQNSLAHY